MISRPIQHLVLGIYRITFNIVMPLLGLISLPFLIFSVKRRHTVLPRLGWQRYPRAPNHQAGAVWIHALSVGETLSAMNLIKETSAGLKDRPLYLSVSTLSGYRLAEEKLRGDIDGLFYFPYDLEFSVRKCLSQIYPALFILVETDIWPGFLAQLRRRNIPCFLLNARLSPQSFRFYHSFLPLFQPTFNTFCRIYPQSQGEAERFRLLGVDPLKIRHCGNLKFDTAGDLPTDESIKPLKDSLGLKMNAQVLVAGSTHAGEEIIIRSVFLRLREQFKELVLLLVPRHPQRGPEVLTLFKNDPVSKTLFSESNHQGFSVLIVDQMGYLNRLYGLADVAFVGGSLVAQGGHNPIEPACWGKPVLFGTDMRDFPDMARWLVEVGGAVQVRDEEELFRQCRWLLENTEGARTMGALGRQLVEEHRGTSRHIVQDIFQFFHN